MSGALKAAGMQMVRCAKCGRVDTPIRAVCAGCLSSELEQVDVPGTGVLVSWTVIRRAPTRFRDQAPYDVVVVDLDGGPRVTGRLSADSPAPSLGARVVAVHAERADALFAVEAA